MSDVEVKIGILETGRLPDDLAAHGDYPRMVRDWLGMENAVSRAYAVLDMEFPDSPLAADAWLITGSRFAAYEDHPWIGPLEEFIRAARDAGVLMVGICFGHQIMAQALGGRVAKSAKGWGLGVHDYTVTHWPEDLGPVPDDLRLEAFHQDQVEMLPEGAEVIATSPFCEYAALWYPGFGVSFQAHPEFGPAFLSDLVRARTGTVIDTETGEAALPAIARPTNSAELAGLVRGWIGTGTNRRRP